MASAVTVPLLQQDEEAVVAATGPSECHIHENNCFLSEGAAKSKDEQSSVQRKLVIACCLCFLFMIAEVIGGYIANSVAVMSDAAHMLSDVSAFLVSIFAAWASTQRSTKMYSFGYHRAEILGALVSILIIWLVTGALVFEAVQRTIKPVPVDGKVMFIVATAGVVFNIVTALVLGGHHHLGGGPCSHSHGGHSHEHNHSHEHDHGHDHSHENGKQHSHDHKHSHAEHSLGDHSHGDHSHGHSHAGGEGHKPGVDAKNHQGSDHQHHHHGPGHSHDVEEGHGHKHTHDCKDHGHSPAVPSAAQHSTVHATGGSSSYQRISSTRGGREIEVRVELPPDMGASRRAPQSACSGHGQAAAEGNINLRGAVIHVIGDLLQSIGVAIAGLLIWMNEGDERWYLADPICTYLFSILVLFTTRSVLTDIVNTLMERAPPSMDVVAVAASMQGMRGIADVHDLHVWNISTGLPVLTAHVHIGEDADPSAVLGQLETYVRSLGINHSTIQICNPQIARIDSSGLVLESEGQCAGHGHSSTDGGSSSSHT